MRLDIKRELNARSERVKSVSLHPTEPWVLSCLYDGTLHIYDYITQSVVKSFESSDQPVRCGCFVPRKQWVMVGCDDMFVRVFNYNTMEKVKMFEAHMDYIRSIAVHPTLPLILTASDDMLIKLWDWERGWSNVMVFEGHAHYVMQVLFNPKDPNTFGSASLDHTIKLWNIHSPIPNLTLEGHEKGVNCIDFYTGADKPYLLSGGDDMNVKIWDYQSRSCVQTLETHSHNVSCVSFVHDRPLIVSGSEDGRVVLWNSNTYRIEATLEYALERCWSVSVIPGVNRLAIGYDLGTVVVSLGKDDPIASLDASGKVIVSRQTDIRSVNLRGIDASTLQDGERVPVAAKELGNTEIYPQRLEHSPNGRFVAVCGDGEYIIYTALAWRNKSFGHADEVVWDSGAGEYATRQGSMDIRVFSKQFKERRNLQPGFSAEGIFGSNLLGVRSSEFICFYDWESLKIVRRIDVVPQKVYWSDSDLVALVTEEAFYVLQFDRNAYDTQLQAGGGDAGPDGVEDSFVLLQEFSDRVTSGTWVGDCFIYTNAQQRLCYVVGNDVTVLHHLENVEYLLGYLARENRLFLINKSLAITSYQLALSVLEYKTAMVRGEVDAAREIVGRVPKAEYNRLAKFLESLGRREEAFELATDSDYRVELAISLNWLELAAEIAFAHPSEGKFRQISEMATQRGMFKLAEECMRQANNTADLLALASAKSDAKLLDEVAQRGAAEQQLNVVFMAHFMRGAVDDCLKILIAANRLPEAAVFARTYCPSKVSPVVELWRADLRKNDQVRLAELLADPKSHGHLFSDFDGSLQAEELAQRRQARLSRQPASMYASLREELSHGDAAELLSREAANGDGGGDTKNAHTNGHAEDGVEDEPDAMDRPDAFDGQAPDEQALDEEALDGQAFDEQPLEGQALDDEQAVDEEESAKQVFAGLRLEDKALHNDFGDDEE